MAFHGGAWVFPGGRIDDGDWLDGDDLPRAAARAAVREATEEAGIEVDVDSLVHFSNWTTPDISPKRFATWFFAAPAHAEIAEAVADGVESDAVRWFRPADALAERAAGEIELAPPQYVTLLWLTDYATVDRRARGDRRRDPDRLHAAFPLPRRRWRDLHLRRRCRVGRPRVASKSPARVTAW